jgi:uncharacterized protein YfkK (UPF0435 family)
MKSYPSTENDDELTLLDIMALTIYKQTFSVVESYKIADKLMQERNSYIVNH